MINRSEVIKAFRNAPVHRRVTFGMLFVVCLTASVTIALVQFLSTSVCNYPVPLSLFGGLAAMFAIGIWYSRTVTLMLEASHLICQQCYHSTIPRPDEIHRPNEEAKFGILTCYHCAAKLDFD